VLCDVITRDPLRTWNFSEVVLLHPFQSARVTPYNHNMSLPAATDQSTYPTKKPAPCDDTSCDTQPTLCSPPQHHIELGPPQRRRVNPESLAARLGPELVAEMEKHIIPGSIEMPPFSVRRDIQIKFGIDRRHIYDFFHSRGLRCLNEKAMRSSFLEVSYQFTPVNCTFFFFFFLTDDRQSPKDLLEVSPTHLRFWSLENVEPQSQHWKPQV